MKHMKQLIALLLALVLCLGLLAGCASKTTDDATTPTDTTPADDTSKDTTEGGEDATDAVSYTHLTLPTTTSV